MGRWLRPRIRRPYLNRAIKKATVCFYCFSYNIDTFWRGTGASAITSLLRNTMPSHRKNTKRVPMADSLGAPIGGKPWKKLQEGKGVVMNVLKEKLKDDVRQRKRFRRGLLHVAFEQGNYYIMGQEKGSMPPRDVLYYYRDLESVEMRMSLMKDFLRAVAATCFERGIADEALVVARRRMLKKLKELGAKEQTYLFPPSFEEKEVIYSFHRVSGSSVVSEGTPHVRVRLAVGDVGKSMLVPVGVYAPWQTFKFKEATREEQKFFASVLACLELMLEGGGEI